MPPLLRRAAFDCADDCAVVVLTEASRFRLAQEPQVKLGKRQRNASAFTRRGVAVPLGEGARLDPPAIARVVHELIGDADRRETMSRQARRLIDGHGPERIRQAMTGW